MRFNIDHRETGINYLQMKQRSIAIPLATFIGLSLIIFISIPSFSQDNGLSDNAVFPLRGAFYNVDGLVLKRLKIKNRDSFEISTNDLNGGVYLIKMSLLSGETQAGKFVKSVRR